MLEGVIAAMAGALLSGGIVLAANALLFSRMGKAFPFLGPVFNFSSGELMSVMFVLLGVGALVGLIGSTMALRRFLEV
jgi:cell division protein FtsX